MEEKKKISVKKIVVLSIIGLVCLAYYAFLIAGYFVIFDNEIYQGLNIFVVSTNKEPLHLVLRVFSSIVLILSFSFFIRLFLNWIVRFMRKGKALVTLISSFIKYLAIIILIFVVLAVCGVETTTLLAGAGILSLIVGLGAQPLIEDIIAGLFIVFEQVFEVGDIIVVEDFRGTVKEMGIRTTKIEDAGGDIKVINNSDIRTLINMTSELSLAICDVAIEYQESLERVESIIRNNLDKLKKCNKAIVNGPFYLGVQTLGSSGVTLRITAECNEMMKFQVQRDLNRAIKLLFDENEINIPFNQLVVHQPETKFLSASEKQKKEAQKLIKDHQEKGKNIADDDSDR